MAAQQTHRSLSAKQHTTCLEEKNRHRKSKMVKKKHTHTARPKLPTNENDVQMAAAPRGAHVPHSCFAPPTTCTHRIASTTIFTAHRLTCKGRTTGGAWATHISLSQAISRNASARRSLHRQDCYKTDAMHPHLMAKYHAAIQAK